MSSDPDYDAYKKDVDFFLEQLEEQQEVSGNRAAADRITERLEERGFQADIVGAVQALQALARAWASPNQAMNGSARVQVKDYSPDQLSNLSNPFQQPDPTRASALQCQLPCGSAM